MAKQEYVIKKKYKELNPPEIVRLSNDFVDDVIFKKAKDPKKHIEISINMYRIIFNIIANIRNDQFQQNTQPRQLKLFEDDFTSEHNTYAEIKIKNSKITRDTKQLKEAYEDLENLGKGWHKFTTSDGRVIQAYGGVISNMFYDEKGYTSFLVNSYWLKKILNLVGYNKVFYHLPYQTTNPKHILFVFWLARLGEEGTKISFHTLNELFQINYSTPKSLCKDFLKPIREKLNKINHLSFNYSIEKDLINIKPYAIKTIQEGIVSEKLAEEVDTNYYLRHYKRRHQLTETQVKRIGKVFDNVYRDKILVIDAYKRFVADCRSQKIKTTNYKGENFMSLLQKFIIIEYQRTSTGRTYPDAYPRI